MRHISDWDSIQEMQPGGFNNPVPGGYLAVITRVEDKEDKEYLEIQWDYAAGPYQGANQETFSRAGFWPTVLRRSYKENALGFFKAFKTAVEESNPGYRFNDYHVQELVGKYVGVVTGLEEYQKKNGEIGQRLYVYQTRSTEAVRAGDYTVPELKKMKPQQGAYPQPAASYGAPAYGAQPSYHQPPAGSGFAEMDDDGDLPF